MNRLPAIGVAFFNSTWESIFHDLNNEAIAPPVESPDGASSITPMARMMEAFGSTDWPDPLLAVSAQINGAKGKVMNAVPAVSADTIDQASRNAVESNSNLAMSNMLSEVRVVSGKFQFPFTKFDAHPQTHMGLQSLST